MGFGDVAKKRSSGSGFGGVIGISSGDDAQNYADQLQGRIANYETRLKAIGVEPPPPKKESNLLLRTLDILDRPRNAIVNTIQDTKSGEDAAGAAFMQGLTGKERANVSDLIPGIENKFARTALGFAGDVALDPLTYLTFGAAGAAKGAGVQGAKTFAKFAGQPIADITPIAKGFGSALQKTGIPEYVGPIFSNKYIRRSVTQPEEMGDIEKARDLIMGTPNQIKGEQQIALNNLQQKWKGVTPQAAQEAANIIEAPSNLALKQQRTQKAIESGKYGTKPTGRSGFMLNETLYPTTNMDPLEANKILGRKQTPGGLEAAKVAREISEETAQKDIAGGVDFGRIPNYVRHLYKDRPEKVMQIINRWQRQRSKLSSKGKFQNERTIPTIEEAKRMGLNPIEDVRVLTAVREMEGIRSRAMNSMYEQLGRLGDNVVKDADQAPAGWVNLPVKQLKGKVVHPEVARFMQRFDDMVSTDEGVRSLITLLGKVQGIWKGLVTAPNPAFHVRNMMGNVYNNFIGGVIRPEAYKTASDIQKGKNLTITLKNGQKYTGKQLFDTFRQLGLEGHGFFFGESPRRMVDEATETFSNNSFGRDLAKGKLVSAGRRVGDAVETNAKLAHFIDKLGKGYSPQQAAESVKKHLFDYSDLTPAEKKIRAFMPFYTFTRKNIPLQLESMVKQPGKFTALHKLIDNTSKTNSVDEENAPDWLKQELAVPVNIGNDEYPEYIMLDLPLTNLNMFEGPQDTLRNFLGMLTPMAKVPVEVAMNKQLFTEAPIEKYPGAQTYWGNILMPAKVGYTLNQLGAIPRTAADIAGAFMEQEPPQGAMPEKPSQIPVLRTFMRSVNPERQEVFRNIEREEQLANLRRYLEEVQGIEVPSVREVGRGFGAVRPRY